jgi:hypothetical protein
MPSRGFILILHLSPSSPEAILDKEIFSGALYSSEIEYLQDSLLFSAPVAYLIKNINMRKPTINATRAMKTSTGISIHLLTVLL